MAYPFTGVDHRGYGRAGVCPDPATFAEKCRRQGWRSLHISDEDGNLVGGIGPTEATAAAAAYNQHMENRDRASRAYAKEPGFLPDVVGYRIEGSVYHPADVEIIYREPGNTATPHKRQEET